MQMDTIFIKGIRCQCTIGVYPWEQATTQTLLFDFECAADFSKAAQSDDITDALDYQKITQRIVEYAQHSRVKLIETLITQLADILMQEFKLSWLRLSLDKGAILKQAKQVGLVTERGSR
jgi:dihydroneopterin aldolase